MNILEAENKLKSFASTVEYLVHGTIGKEKEGEDHFFDYLNSKTKIFEAKKNSNILSLEFSKELLIEEKWFYNLDIRTRLYKDHVSDESVEYCKAKLAEIEDEIKEVEEALIKEKAAIQI